MEKGLNTIFYGEVDLSKEDSWKKTLINTCFQIFIEAKTNEESGATVSLKVEPESEGYEIIVSYKLDADKSSECVEFDKWRIAEELICIKTEGLVFEVSFSIHVDEILAPQNLAVPTSLRNFHVLTSEIDFYVNTAQLKDLGGKLFKEWYDKECVGEDTVVVQSMDARELEVLLNASCAYSAPIIHKRNFGTVVKLVEEYRIDGLLRCIETFLIRSKSIHKIRKLEYASRFRLARLADFVLRSFKSKHDRIDSLYIYLATNGENLEDVHPDILEMFEISPVHIVL